MCDWGVLLYKLDVTVLNSYGSIKVVDAMPLSTDVGLHARRRHRHARQGPGRRPRGSRTPQTGTLFEVLSIEDGAAPGLKVTRAVTRITATPGAPLAALRGAHFNAPAAAAYAWAFGDGTTARAPPPPTPTRPPAATP